MQRDAWELIHPIDAIMFDCDSTLSQIEGITALARKNQVEEIITELTERAMNITGMTPELYRRRLELVQPTALQIKELGQLYYQYVTLDADKVINVLHSLGKTVYIVSAGIAEAVLDFADHLKIPRHRVYAVPIYFDQEGRYDNFDARSILTTQTGKSKIVALLRQSHTRIAHVGDGMNDVEAAKYVDRFIGYGGVCFRPAIAALCKYYLKSLSLLSLLPLLLTKAELPLLNAAQLAWYQEGVSLL